MRLINADILFENVGKIKPRNKEHYKSIGEFMNMITNTSTIAVKWTSVSDGLPKKNGDYIVSLEDSIYPRGRFFNGKWYMLPRGGVAVEFGANEVVAWMPLPEAYKGNDTEDSERIEK